MLDAQGKPVSVGLKRNRAVEASHGKVIAHFDDDDCYGPSYLDVMVAALLGGFDIVKLVSWYNFDIDAGLMGHLDLEARMPFPICQRRDKYKLSYGWSFVYRRSLASCIPFPDTSWGEDVCFIGTAGRFGCRVKQVPDAVGIALHTFHSGSTSRLTCQTHTPADAPQRAPGSFLEDAVAALSRTAALGSVAGTAGRAASSSSSKLSTSTGSTAGRARNMFCWSVHAKKKMWAEGVPRDGEGEMCEEFGEWMQAQIERDAETSYAGRPEGFRQEMRLRAAVSANNSNPAGASSPSAAPEFPPHALRAISALGLRPLPPGAPAREQPLPLEPPR